MTIEELEAILSRAAKASAGPWSASWSGWVDAAPNAGVVTRSGFVRAEDAAFVAHARTDVPRLVAEVRALHGPRGAATVPDAVMDAYKRVASEARAFVDHPAIRATLSAEYRDGRTQYGLLLDAIDALDSVLGAGPAAGEAS